MSILVCIPTAYDIHALTTAAAFRICSGHQAGAEFRTFQARPTDFARNLCARFLMEGSHSHLLFIDSDIVPPDDCLDLMLAARRPLVCGVYPLLLDNSRVCTCLAEKTGENRYNFLDTHGDTPFEVDVAGLGCCLIAREVFTKLPYPWFQFEQKPDGQLIGEDFRFFEDAARVGYKPLIIPQIQCAHYKNVNLFDVIRAVQLARQAQPLASPVGA